MKKITLIFMLFSICTLASAQLRLETNKKEKNTQETQNEEKEAFYIYSPSTNMVLEASNVQGNASSALRFNQLQKGGNNQLFVFDKYFDDWNLIYNLQTKDYLVINGNQVGLGGFVDYAKIKIRAGKFYIDYQGQERKLMINKYGESRGTVSRGDISRGKYPSLGIDVSNRSDNINTYFELYGSAQYAELLAKTEKVAIPVSPPPQAIPKPTITNIVCPHMNQIISQNYTTISATIENVPEKESIQVTLNGRKIPFGYRGRQLNTGAILLTEGTNKIEIFVRNASGTHSITRNVYYRKTPPPPPVETKPAIGKVTIKLNQSKCDGNYFVILEDLENKNNRFEIRLDEYCKAYKDIPVGTYKVQFNLSYSDAGCDSCENELKFKRINTTCPTNLTIGKNEIKNLSCTRQTR